MNPSDFIDSSVSKHPENFVEELKKVFKVMHIVDVDRAQLPAY